MKDYLILKESSDDTFLSRFLVEQNKYVTRGFTFNVYKQIQGLLMQKNAAGVTNI